MLTKSKVIQMHHAHNMGKKIAFRTKNVASNIAALRETRLIKTNTKDDLSLGSEIWIAGKGASFDSYDWSVANQYRIGINETAFLIPDCWGAIALDFRVLQKYMNELDKNILVFLKHTQFKASFPKQFVWSPVDCKAIVFGTANAALCLFYWLGARKIHLVGFDSISGDAGYARRIIDINAKGTNRDKYRKINKRLVEWIITKDDLEIIFEHDAALNCKDLVNVYSDNLNR